MKTVRQDTDPGSALRTPRAAGWAAAYLLAAGALIAVAGSELSGPSPEKRARSLERETARELAALVEAASAVARSRLEEDRRRVLERDRGRGAALEAALAAVRSWARGLEGLPEDADICAELSAAAPDLAPVLPDGVAVALVAPSGERVFETGGAFDLDSPRALMAPAGGFLTAAVVWAGKPAHAERGPVESLGETLAAAVAPGTGLYFVTEDGSVAAEVSPRPMPAMPLGAPVGTGRAKSVVKTVTGDLETGRLVAARRAVRSSAELLSREPAGELTGGLAGKRDGAPRLTAVAERFLSPEILAVGAGGLAGMLALTGLGVVAAGAFAHAFYAGFTRGPARESAPAPLGVAVTSARRTQSAEVVCEPVSGGLEAEPVPSGESIVRLRESLGATGEGPDLAACARSPILRALSRCVRHPGPAVVPHEVSEWARCVLVEKEGKRRKVA